MYTAAAHPPCQTRAAVAGDLDGILALYRELRPQDPEPLPNARKVFDRMLARDDVQIVVCEVDGQLVSTCMLALIPNLASGTRPIGLIEHVVTLAARREHGYARRVLEHALSVAWEKSCCKVMLLSGTQRGDAYRLYESVGFAGDVERGFVVKAP